MGLQVQAIYVVDSESRAYNNLHLSSHLLHVFSITTSAVFLKAVFSANAWMQVGDVSEPKINVGFDKPNRMRRYGTHWQ